MNFKTWQISLLDAADPIARLRDLLNQQRARQRDFTDHNVWIRAFEAAEIEPYLEALGTPDDQPLWGLPFAIKDNIDLANVETTAGCPAYGYTPDESAPVVADLIRAGAIPVGKTNLDQFATGLVGTRSPYGAARNAIDPRYIAGGSSSGSAIAVAAGLASFSLGTDTAGSGRIPAGFNGLVGFKPSRGTWSTRGVVPACRTLDCVSVFATSVGDAHRVRTIAARYDAADPFARRLDDVFIDPDTARYGTITGAHLDTVSPSYRNGYEGFLARLPNRTVIDPEDLFRAARLLYDGPWVAERASALGHFLETNADDIHPTTRAIITPGRDVAAVDYFDKAEQLAMHRRQCEALFESIDVLVLPTAPTIFTMEEVDADPIATNTRLGTFTNFVNLLDLCAIAIPAAPIDGLPFGVTLIANRGADDALLQIAARLLGEAPLDTPTPAGDDHLEFAVCGAHLRGQPLNDQLLDAGAAFVETTTTAARYGFYALPDNKRPALIRRPDPGAAIEVEIWRVPSRSIGPLLNLVAPPLGFGSLELANGRWVKGFIAEGIAADGARDISEFGGWRRYRAAQADTTA